MHVWRIIKQMEHKLRVSEDFILVECWSSLLKSHGSLVPVVLSILYIILREKKQIERIRVIRFTTNALVSVRFYILYLSFGPFSFVFFCCCWQALELQPGDKNALVSRSRCRILLGDTKGALEDAEHALRIDQQCVKGQSAIRSDACTFHVRFTRHYAISDQQGPDLYAFTRIYRSWWWWFNLIININIWLLICNTYYRKRFNTYYLYHQGL